MISLLELIILVVALAAGFRLFTLLVVLLSNQKTRDAAKLLLSLMGVAVLVLLVLLAGLGVLGVLGGLYAVPVVHRDAPREIEVLQQAADDQTEETAIDVSSPEEDTEAGEVPQTLPADVSPADEPAALEPPDWVGKEPFKRGSVYVWPVKCDPRPSRTECEEEALPAAVHEAITKYVETKLKLDRHSARSARLPHDYVRDHMIGGDVWIEPVEVSFGDWVQMHALVKFDREANALIEERWATIRHGERLCGVGVMAGMLLLMLASAYTLLKIDLLTGGKYRRRLRLAVAAAIILLVIAGLAIVTA